MLETPVCLDRVAEWSGHDGAAIGAAEDLEQAFATFGHWHLVADPPSGCCRECNPVTGLRRGGCASELVERGNNSSWCWSGGGGHGRFAS